MKFNIAIVGATGMVGRTTLKILEEKNLTNYNFFLYASDEDAGKTINFAGEDYVVKKLCGEIFKEDLNYALFCTSEEVSKKYIELLAKNGVVVIDFSSIFRKNYPLIIPEINFSEAKGNILCNPNCSTAAAVMALKDIYKHFGLERVVYSTYQAVSGAGRWGLEDLKVTNKKDLKKFDYVIHNNVIPYIGEVDEMGYSAEENKMIFETRKILGDESIKITATCVRVPIENSHSLSVNFKTKKKASVKEIEEVLLRSEGVKVLNEYNHYPMPIEVTGKDEVYVGRIRKDESEENSFNMFVVSDNLRKGAAQNAVQILERLIKERNE